MKPAEHRTVLIVTSFHLSQCGGMRSHIGALLRDLPSNGYIPMVMSLDDIVPSVRRVFCGVFFHLTDRFNRLLTVRAQAWSLNIVLGTAILIRCLHCRPTLINMHDVWLYPSLRRIANLLRIPLVATVHGYAAFEPVSQGYLRKGSSAEKFILGLERKAYSGADALITVDTRISRHVVDLGADPSRTSVIKNFLDVDFYAEPSGLSRADICDNFGLNSARRVLLCPRRLVKKNGVVYPLLAMLHLREQHPDITLVYAGWGPEKADLEQRVEEDSLGDCVRLLGRVERDELKLLYELSDMVLIPSVHLANVEEATSISALEAMASGKPIVASNVGGLAELIEDGRSGILVEDADPEAIANAVHLILCDANLAAHLGTRASEDANRHHRSEVVVGSIAHIYSEAVVRSCGSGGS